MKFRKVAALCRSMGKVLIIERHAAAGGVVQYIGTGGVYYMADGLPLLDKYNVLPTLDVPANKRADFEVQIFPDPGTVSFADAVPDEMQMIPEPVQITTADGITLQPISGGSETLWFDTRHIKPIEDCAQLTFTRRKTADGTPYIAAKDGLFLQAIIFPTVLSTDYVADLRRLSEQTKFVSDNDADDNSTD